MLILTNVVVSAFRASLPRLAPAGEGQGEGQRAVRGGTGSDGERSACATSRQEQKSREKETHSSHSTQVPLSPLLALLHAGQRSASCSDLRFDCAGPVFCGDRCRGLVCSALCSPAVPRGSLAVLSWSGWRSGGGEAGSRSGGEAALGFAGASFLALVEVGEAWRACFLSLAARRGRAGVEPAGGEVGRAAAARFAAAVVRAVGAMVVDAAMHCVLVTNRELQLAASWRCGAERGGAEVRLLLARPPACNSLGRGSLPPMCCTNAPRVRTGELRPRRAVSAVLLLLVLLPRHVKAAALALAWTDVPAPWSRRLLALDLSAGRASVRAPGQPRSVASASSSRRRRVDPALLLALWASHPAQLRGRRR